MNSVIKIQNASSQPHFIDGQIKVGTLSYPTVNIQNLKTIPNNQIIFKNTYFEFPNIGDSEKLYIAIEDNELYLWEEEMESYICVTDYDIDYLGAGDAFGKIKVEEEKQ